MAPIHRKINADNKMCFSVLIVLPNYLPQTLFDSTVFENIVSLTSKVVGLETWKTSKKKSTRNFN